MAGKPGAPCRVGLPGRVLVDLARPGGLVAPWACPSPGGEGARRLGTGPCQRRLNSPSTRQTQAEALSALAHAVTWIHRLESHRLISPVQPVLRVRSHTPCSELTLSGEYI